MSEDILGRLLDMMVDMKVKVDKIDGLESSIKDLQTSVGRLESTIDTHGEMLSGLTSDVRLTNDRLVRLDAKVDKIDGRTETVESELGTVMDAVLALGRTVKDHDLAIKEIRARYN
ncbi:MAG: hypothetical protein HZC51_09615 [Nitrospirae bacterium]|nr:hypothetical protein [Nitrospirota bacterium]